MSSQSRLLVRALDYIPECYGKGGQNPLWVVSSGLACAIPCAASLQRKQFQVVLSLATVKLFLKHSPTFFLSVGLRIGGVEPLSVAELAEVVKQLPQLLRLNVTNLAGGSDDQLLDVVLSAPFLEDIYFLAHDSGIAPRGSPYRSARFEVGVMTRHHNEHMRQQAIWRLATGLMSKKISPADAITAGAIEHLVQAVLPAIRAPRSDRDGDGGQLPLIARHSDQFELWEGALRCLKTVLYENATARGMLGDDTVTQLEPLLTDTAVFNIESQMVLGTMMGLLASATQFPALLNLLCGDDGSGGVDQHGVLAVAARDILPQPKRLSHAPSNIMSLLASASASPTRGADIRKHVVEDWQVLPVVVRILSSRNDDLMRHALVVDISIGLVHTLLQHCFDDVLSFEQGKIVEQLCALATDASDDYIVQNASAALVFTIRPHPPENRQRALAIMSSCGVAEKLVRFLMDPSGDARRRQFNDDRYGVAPTEVPDARVDLLSRILGAELTMLAERLRYQFSRSDMLGCDAVKMNRALRRLSAAERDWFAAQQHFAGWTQLLNIAAEKQSIFDTLIDLDRQRLERVPRVGSGRELFAILLQFVTLIETHLQTARPLDYPESK